MLVAHEKRKTNIAEYILYMWQIEDLLRACSFDPEIIGQQLVARFQANKNTEKEITDWYLSLASAMNKENIREKGHLLAITNNLNDLNEFHLKMLEQQNDQEYLHLYRVNSGAIAELMQRSGNSAQNEIEACLNALYGLMTLKLKKAEISESTQKTVQGFGQLIGHLSARYIQFENDEFDFR
ncbi:MAG: DUF4924 family protein [Prolixibacteraceae bacterium]|nr:DUF4924 family protein [Prolixibacteraceae bacterium]